MENAADGDQMNVDAFSSEARGFRRLLSGENSIRGNYFIISDPLTAGSGHSSGQV